MKHKPIKLYEIIKIKGSSIERSKKTCPRCGDGTFLAQHKDRLYCGRCYFTEFLGKK